MRILFDHQVFSWQRYGGISRYFTEQLRELKSLDQEVFLPENFFSENVYLREFPDFKRKSLTAFSFKGKKILQNALGRQNTLRAIDQKKPHVFHPTYFDPYFLKTLAKKRIPFVLTVHDMIHEIYGHGSGSFFSLDAQVVKNKKLLAEKAAVVIAVSEHTRQDLLRFCPQLDPGKIKVIHHGNSLTPTVPPISVSTHYASRITHNPSYLLFVGQRKSYKNFAWMVEQLAGLLHSATDLQLICVGGSAFDKAETAQLSQLGLAQKVHYRSIGSDAALANVYSGATCFIFPSKYEGFGMPVLEAFACGCPVVLNRTSSLPEVGGDAAVYFDEANPGSLELAVRRILEEPGVKKHMVEKGLERVKHFTWAQSAAKHLGVYQSIVH